MIKVFLIILNWNRAKDTLECLASVKQLEVKGFELNVLVVDNFSTDNSYDRLNSYKLDNGNYVLIRNKTNLGFSGGNNIGIRYALKKAADFVIVLNNDTRVSPKLVTEFLKLSHKNKKLGAASPKIYFEKGYEFKKQYNAGDLGKVLWYAGGKIDWDNVYGSSRGVDEVDKGQYDCVEETDYATGTCLFLTREALTRAGYFDDKFFMYYEDTDISMRIKKKGFKVMYVPTTVIWHKVAQSSGIGSELNDYFITRNRLLFGIKYAKMRTRIALLREGLRLLINGRKWQKRGVIDYFISKFGKGSWA